jgi:hypothetical protein
MSAAVQLAFLMDGFNQSRTDCGLQAQDTYEVHSGNHGGYIGIVCDMYDYAVLVDQELDNYCNEYYEKHGTETNYPGVFEYEVTEEIGKWLFYHPEHFSSSAASEAFAAETFRRTRFWFALNQPPVSEDTTTPRESTMTVEQLIAQLQALDNPTLEILTRGSEANKMVEASVARVVKTKTRTAVFIGKPKALNT